MTDRSVSLDEEQLVAVLGFPVQVKVQGEGDPILLINGLTRPLASWEPFAAELRNRQVITFDVPGIGASPTPLWPLSIPRLAAIAAAVLDEVGVERADVLGYSHGGTIAQELAHESPQRVRGLILVSTSCGVGSTVGDADVLTSLGSVTGSHPWPRVDSIGVLWHSLAVASWSSIPFLGSIVAPTLVVTGEHDRLVPPTNAALLARRIPGATMVKLSAGHDLQQPHHAEALARAVADFLTSLDVTA